MPSVAEIVTDQIIKAMERGVIPWQKPWVGDAANMNAVSKKAYRGVNVWLLTIARLSGGFASNYWMTFKQAEAAGGMVRKGSKGTLVVFAQYPDKKESELPDEDDRKRAVIRYYYVFNLDQIDGLPVEFLDKLNIEHDVIEFNPIDAAERLIAGMPADMPEIRHGEQRAYYSPQFDFINMPARNSFVSEEAYYVTLFHEAIHATGHAKRLNRKTLTESDFFGGHNYSREELVAEMGSAILGATIGLEKEIDNSAAYVAGWLKKLNSDRSFVISAASQAQKAVEYILQRQL